MRPLASARSPAADSVPARVVAHASELGVAMARDRLRQPRAVAEREQQLEAVVGEYEQRRDRIPRLRELGEIDRGVVHAAFEDAVAHPRLERERRAERE